jgi:Ca2+/Na+ antiporter
MIYEEILFMLVITIFALIVHYYIGVINIWYIPSFEILVALVIYQISIEMYKSYSTYKEHKQTQENARKEQTIPIENNKITIPKEERKIKFEKTKEVIKFPVDEKVINKIEVSYGKEEIVSEDENEESSMHEEIKNDKTESV